MRIRNCSITLGLLGLLPSVLGAQTPVRIELSSAPLSVAVSDRVQLTAQVFDADGNQLDVPVRFYSSARRDFPIQNLQRVATADVGKQAGGIAFWKLVS